MKRKIYLILVFILTSLSIFGQAPDWLWAKNASGSNSALGQSICNDANGNVYVAGYFGSPTITFGGVTLTSNGGIDVFVVKYNSVGNVIWAKNAGGNANDFAHNITTDNNGNVFVTGDFQSLSFIFGLDTLSIPSGRQAFILKYDSLGTQKWAKQSVGASESYGYGICTDKDDNVYFTGSFGTPQVTFGSVTLNNVSGIGYYDVFIVKYDSGGNVPWAKSAGGMTHDVGYSIASDVNNNIYVTGYFNGPTIIFGNDTLTNVTTNNDADIFIAKYDSSGNAIWGKSAGGNSTDASASISKVLNGSFYLTGFFVSPTISFGSNVLTNSGGNDLFVVKYDTSGNALWARNAIGGLNDRGYSISMDSSNNAYVTGAFLSSSIIFGSATLINSGLNFADIFIVKYDSSANVVWAKSVGDVGNEEGKGITIDDFQNIYVTGYFNSSSIAFGSYTLSNSGTENKFAGKLGFETGVNENQSLFNLIIVYPNPTLGKIKITSLNYIEKIVITDIKGQIFYQTNCHDKNIVLTLNKKGIYFAHVTTNEQTIVKKIILD